MEKPKIVCLCGSTKFKLPFEKANKRETLDGKIVLSVGCFPHFDNEESPEEYLGKDKKSMMDELHKRKIDLADEVFVLNGLSLATLRPVLIILLLQFYPLLLLLWL